MTNVNTNYSLDLISNSKPFEKYYYWSANINGNKTSSDVLDYEFHKSIAILKPELDRSNQSDDEEKFDQSSDTFEVVLVPMAKINMKHSSYKYIYNIDGVKYIGLVAVVSDLIHDLPSQIVSNLIDYKTELRKKIETFKYLDKDWALEDCTLPTSEAIQDGHYFIDMLPIDRKPPILEIATDGEINFFWRFNEIVIDVGFYGDKMIHYFIKMDTGEVVSEIEDFNTKALPHVLRKAIVSV